jgi:N-acetyl-anhydromuramyl-L-alanine amidase AmpD
MKFDKTKWLNESQFTSISTVKNKIIIGNTFTDDMKFFNGWLLRNGNNNQRVSHFSIDKDGTIYQHVNENMTTQFSGEYLIDTDSISISLVNEGWLVKKNDKYINLNGTEYKNKVKRQQWRGFMYWAPYPNKQIQSLSKLILFLSKKYSIYNKIQPHYLLIDDIKSSSGIFFRGNITDHYTDVNPIFDNDKLKEILKWN